MLSIHSYGGKVTLCTTGDESSEFCAALHQTAAEHGFEIFIDQRLRPARYRALTHKARASAGQNLPI